MENEPFIWLQDDETEGEAECGCRLYLKGGNPAFDMCDRHAKATTENKYLRLLSVPPMSWRQEADAMKPDDRDKARLFLAGLAERCATFSAYLDERHGCGCGDQGHKKGVKKANKVGRLLWCKGFGYNDYHDVSF